MHRCWSIPEIVTIICEKLSSESEYGEREVDGLAIFARSCRTVHEQALDVLWHKQETIVPLLRCMPDDVWEARDSFDSDGDYFATILVKRDTCVRYIISMLMTSLSIAVSLQNYYTL